VLVPQRSVIAATVA